MTRSLHFKHEAESDIRDTVKWYQSRSQRLAARFLRSLDATLARVERNPFGYQIIYRSARRATLRTFPYNLIYVIRENDIVVVACVHGHRDPSEWMQRLQS
jgi:toxin ParE1/3/4